MENKIEIFKNEELGEVRSLLIDGEPWFVGKDIAEALGYEKARNAISAHVDKEDKKGAPIQGVLGGTQEMTIINESGMYALIFGSELDSAKKFKHWVTKDVLPTIRKHGMYITEELLKDKEMLESKVKLLSEKSKLVESISYLHYSIKRDSDVDSYMPSIMINIFNACRKSIVKEDDTHYYFVDKDVNTEAIKYDIKSKRFKELLSLMGGYKNSAFVKTEGGYKIRFECYIIRKCLIDSKL